MTLNLGSGQMQGKAGEDPGGLLKSRHSLWLLGCASEALLVPGSRGKQCFLEQGFPGRSTSGTGQDTSLLPRRAAGWECRGCPLGCPGLSPELRPCSPGHCVGSATVGLSTQAARGPWEEKASQRRRDPSSAGSFCLSRGCCEGQDCSEVLLKTWTSLEVT